jgi:hypothetical protein
VMWTLKWQTENGWVELGQRRYGDACKTLARRHQIGFGRSNKYRIYRPDGGLHLEGKPMLTLRGVRMTWQYSANNDRGERGAEQP